MKNFFIKRNLESTNFALRADQFQTLPEFLRVSVTCASILKLSAAFSVSFLSGCQEIAILRYLLLISLVDASGSTPINS